MIVMQYVSDCRDAVRRYSNQRFSESITELIMLMIDNEEPLKPRVTLAKRDIMIKNQGINDQKSITCTQYF